MKKVMITTFFLFATIAQCCAFENCIITNNGKLTDISIEDNSIVDVYPLITVMNEKNTLMVQPLKAGQTRVCVLKNNKDKIMFNIKVDENSTSIDEVDGFEITTLDEPPVFFDYDLDTPPKTLKGEK